MGEVDMKPVKLERGLTGSLIQDEIKISTPDYQGSEGNRSSNVLSTSQSGTSVLDQGQSPVDETNLSSVSPLCPAPLCRQFWKAGNYDESLASKTRIQNSKNYLHVHPKFLHSNATSHKWAFGAIAELLDNAIDEIQNGATFVIVDKISNPRDGTPALLIQDDGGGMDPEAMRRCMSFGFSDKKSTSAIGRYGNGFKTSTMRLGADVVVFSRHVGSRTLTQSIGLLSYTYLTRTGLDRIVVPMVDYDFNMSTGASEPQYHNGRELFQSNLSIILQWSPFSTETELLKQFDNIESHGTKVIIYNLWLMDDGNLEFDFETDPKDIRLHGSQDSKKISAKMLISEAHIGNQYRYSLLVYLSILYLRMPQSFTIILRGEVVEHHNIASDLKFPEFILYKPQTAGVKEGQVITTIGFLKEAPHVYLHGFNVYHKNRLILPFWHVVSYSDSRGRGVVGILEANFVEPTHNKQDFERTSLFQKLEARLKEMTWEYWDYHCGLIGYQVKKKARLPASLHDPPYKGPKLPRSEPVNMDVGTRRIRQPNGTGPVAIVHDLSASGPAIQNSQGTERKQDDFLLSLGRGRRQYKSTPNTIDVQDSNEIQPTAYTSKPVNEHEASVLMQEQNKLQAKCLEHEKMEEELNQKVAQIEKELEMARDEYARMLEELQSLEAVKPERSFYPHIDVRQSSGEEKPPHDPDKTPTRRPSSKYPKAINDVNDRLQKAGKLKRTFRQLRSCVSPCHKLNISRLS